MLRSSSRPYLEQQKLGDKVLGLVRDVSEGLHVEAHLSLLDSGQRLAVILAPSEGKVGLETTIEAFYRLALRPGNKIIIFYSHRDKNHHSLFARHKKMTYPKIGSEKCLLFALPER